MRRKILAICITISLCFTMAPMLSEPAYGYEDGDFVYGIYEGAAAISGYNGTATDVVVPATVGGYPVRYINRLTFNWNDTITSVVLPEGVELMDSGTFYNCTALTSVHLPESLTTIQSGMFKNCSSLVNVNFPENLEVVGGDAFLGSKWLEQQPDGPIYIRSNLYTYKGRAIEGTTLTVDPGTTRISDKALIYQTGISEVVLPEGLAHIGAESFKGMSMLESVNMPSSLLEIGAEAFAQCLILQGLNLPEGLTTIGSKAFQSNHAMTELTIPSTVTYMGEYLTNMSANFRHVYFSEGLKEIGNGAFLMSYHLEAPDFPDSLIKIGDSAFKFCDNIQEIVLPDSVVSIGANAFSSCEKLSSVTLNEGLKFIGAGAFQNSLALMNINIPTTVDNMEAGAFYGTPWKETWTDGMIYFNNIAYEYKGIMPEHTTIELEPGTVAIAHRAFYNQDNLDRIVIPGSVKTIGKQAFEACGNLYVIMEEGVNNIGARAFSYINSIKVRIPRSVTDFATDAFYSNNYTTLYVYDQSAAHAFAVAKKLPFKFIWTVTFDSQGGTDVPSADVSGGMLLKKPADPSREGYTFGFWYRAVLPNESWPFETQSVGGNMTLYAKWIPNTYNIRFNGNGATSGTMSSLPMSYDVAKTLPSSTLIKNGYIFLGWATSPTGSVVYKDKAPIKNLTATNGATIDLYAKWGPPINAAASYNYNSVKISWAAAGGATSYRIYRATSATGSYTLINVASATARSYVNTGLVTGKTYYYKVSVVAGGKTYHHSAYKSAKAIPATPTVNLSKYSTTSIKVSWTGISGATKYQIFRATSATGSYSYLYTTSSTARSWVNTGLTRGKTYYYKVRAYHLEGTTKVYGASSAVKYLKM